MRRPSLPAFRVAVCVLLALPLGCGGGDGGSGDCDGLEGVTTCQPEAKALPPDHPPPTDTGVTAVHVYVDRSGSMAGYLDTSFSEFGVAGRQPTLRRVLDRVLTLGGTGARVYGYGDRVSAVQGRSNQDLIGTLVRQQFYSQNNTRLEDVLDSIAADTARATTHLIVGDGRRGDGASAIAQFRRLGTLAESWAGGDSPRGFFAMVVVDAPFHQVRGDKAGCWSAGGNAEGIRCPLYVFAFGPGRAAPRVLAALRDAATRLYAAPTFTDAAGVVEAKPGAAPGALNVQGGGRSGRPLELFYHSPDSATSARVPVRVNLANSVARFALDDSLTVAVQSTAIAPQAAAWEPVHDLGSAWVRPATPARDSAAPAILLPVDLRSRPQVPKTAYRIDLLSAGVPGWLQDYEATAQGDATRTYGLSALFTQLRPHPTRLATFYARIY